jgi:hypothetical protein
MSDITGSFELNSGELPRAKAPKHAAAEAPQAGLGARKPSRWNVLRTKPAAMALTGLAVAGAAYGVADWQANKHWDKKVAVYKESTETLLEGWRANGAPIANHNLLLQAGVTYRTTPDLIGSGPSFFVPRPGGNVAGTVPSGDVMAIHDAAELIQPDGSVWFAFQKNDGMPDKSTVPLTSSQVAEQTYFVNFSQLKGQTLAGTKQPIAEVLPNGENDNCTVSKTHGSLEPNGQFLGHDGATAAWALGESINDYDANARLFGIGSCAVDATK